MIRRGVVTCISLAISGALALPTLLLSENLLTLTRMVALFLLLPLIASKISETRSLGITLVGLVSAFAWILNLKLLAYILMLSYILSWCSTSRSHVCLYGLSVLSLFPTSNITIDYLIVTIVVLVMSITSWRITGRVHTLILLTSLPLFILVKNEYWGLLILSMLAGILAITFSWPSSCPFRKEFSLVSVGSVLSIVSLISLVLMDSTVNDYALALWETGFLLQISGIMVPRSSFNLKERVPSFKLHNSYK